MKITLSINGIVMAAAGDLNTVDSDKVNNPGQVGSPSDVIYRVPDSTVLENPYKFSDNDSGLYLPPLTTA